MSVPVSDPDPVCTHVNVRQREGLELYVVLTLT